MKYLLFALAGFLPIACAGAQPSLLPNGSFEEGADAPTDWSFQGATGTWERTGHTGERCVSVTGAEGEESAYWRCPQVAFAPRRTYRFRFFSRLDPRATGGCIVSGPSFCNRDYGGGAEWEEHTFVFVTPGHPTGAYVRLGEWTKVGKVYFDDAELTVVTPVHATREEGEGRGGKRTKEREGGKGTDPWGG